MTQLVFVYGTLMSGDYNHSVMERAGGKFVGNAVTDDRYTMFHLGGFPCVWKDLQHSEIYGEVYEVEDTKPLDWLEGAPTFYHREVTPVTTDSGEEIQAWMYFLNPNYNDQPTMDRVIENGRWKNQALSA